MLLTLESTFQFQNICVDHVAFRSFGSRQYGLDATKQIFQDLGFHEKEFYQFKAKKLRAVWMAPPKELYDLIPRIFISEIILNDLSKSSQKIISSYLSEGSTYNSSSLVASVLTGHRPWKAPSFKDFESLSKESEYAAWVLAQGYSLNHFAISTHRLHRKVPLTALQAGVNHQGDVGGINSTLISSNDIQSVTDSLQHQGYLMNQEGGIIKVSPDGGLLQSSTLADLRPIEFDDGMTRFIPGAYAEFVQRRVLPEYLTIPEDDVKEYQRRDGFETDNADKIFESTYVQNKMKA
jgi:hypothetical protein